jgi:hypothetical protein
MKSSKKNKRIGERGTAHLSETVKRLERRVLALERSDEEREYRDDPEITQVIHDSRDDYKAGRSRPAREVLAELKTKKR